ncbi:hypothetical protein AURDEDRAFT_110370 [Auricularia subglabra TFB-10046 SS5]|nr:hypothetical protein AURDEDRAFT_110370 [Auricularia subglabra TFB-10046 SS5]
MIRLPHSLVLLLLSAVARGGPYAYTAEMSYSRTTNYPIDCDQDLSVCESSWWMRTNDTYTQLVTAGPSAQASTTFYGSKVSVLGAYSPDGAVVKITLDGQWVLVDTSRPEWVFPAPLFQQNWLDPSVEHTLELDYVASTTTSGVRKLIFTSVQYELPETTSSLTARDGAKTGVTGSVGSTGNRNISSSGDDQLPIAAIVQGIMGALVILPAAVIMLVSVWRHRRGGVHDQDDDRWDGNFLGDGADDAQPLFHDHLPSGGSSRRSSAGSVLGALPNMATLRMDTSLSLRSLPRSTTPQQKLQRVWERTSSRNASISSTLKTSSSTH